VPKGKASLWAENCPNFLAGTSPKGAGKTEVFSGKKFALSSNLKNVFIYLVIKLPRPEGGKKVLVCIVVN
jgi:hypothetical protein